MEFWTAAYDCPIRLVFSISQSSVGARRSCLIVPRRVLVSTRAARFERLGRVGRRGGGGGAMIWVTSSISLSVAICWLRLSERSSWTVIRSGRSSRPSPRVSRSTTPVSRPITLSDPMVNSARVEALSRCCPPGPLERLAVQTAPLSKCSTTSPASMPPCKNVTRSPHRPLRLAELLP